ncbi:hypothetical protein [Sorangium sp. So ce128]|uniref:hypothetical protein n=1 Tax=Sorangium sp. So ce128 TaxID=3133281 RepID=UPI003F62DE9F
MLILDTNIVRKLILDGYPVDAFVSYAREGGTVHLADSTIVEILSWLQRPGDGWSAWKRERDKLQAFVDGVRPVLMGGREILAQAGLLLDAPPAMLPPSDQEEINRTIWRFLSTAASPEELGPVRAHIRNGAGRSELVLDPSGASRQVASEKESWVEMFGRYGAAAEAEGFSVDGRTVSRKMIDEIAVRLGRFVDQKATSSPPPASVRLDAMIRVHVLLSLRSLQTKERYNARKESNDVFDFDLYRYLALPAALCTSDGGIIRDLRAAGAWQVEWVVTPEALADPECRRRLLSLRWPS